MVAFLLSFAGSDLPAGVTSDPDRPPGLAGRDTAASVGLQVTINNSNSLPLIDTLIALATANTGRVDLVVKGFKDGLGRGWVFDRNQLRFYAYLR